MAVDDATGTVASFRNPAFTAASLAPSVTSVSPGTDPARPAQRRGKPLAPALARRPGACLGSDARLARERAGRALFATHVGARLDAERLVDLVVGQRPLAGRGSDDEFS